MKTSGKCQLLVMFLLGIIIVSSCGTTIKQSKGQKFYLAHNIWYEEGKVIRSPGEPNSMTIAAINYKTGRLVRAGTEVNDVTVFGGKIKFHIPSQYLIMSVKVNNNFDPGLDGQKLFDRMITEKNLESITSDFSELETNAIRSGILIKGMSKEAVLVSFGYPPAHRTPDLESNAWYFWRNKWGKLLVEFDDDGKVKEDVIP